MSIGLFGFCVIVFMIGFLCGQWYEKQDEQSRSTTDAPPPVQYRKHRHQ